MTFVFNKDYNDKAQVEQYLPAYMKRYDELKAAGQYPYNDSFKGHCGIEADDKNEDTAIYLLQGIRHLNEEHARIDALRAEGFQMVDELWEQRRYTRIVLYRPEHYVGGTGAVSEYESARLVPDGNGRPYAVLPKGARTRGYMVQDAVVLALA